MKKRSKKFLSLCLALVMALALVPTAAFAADSDFLIADGVLVQYKGPGGDVTIPDGVTSIGEWGVFRDCTVPTRVTIPDSVTHIGHAAFYECKNLIGMTIPDSVTSIESCAFLGCVNLADVTIPNSVTSLEYQTFCNCNSLTSITIPSSVTHIGREVFWNCTGLTSVTIPDSVTRIESGAFALCTGLTSAVLPSSVTSIENNTFRSCTSLTSVTIPDSVTSIEEWAFCDCTSLTDVYYGGTEAQWKDVVIKKENDPLTSATVHYQEDTANREENTGEQPELPLADVAVPVQAGHGVYYDLVRITHAVALETVECDGESLELYSIYPKAMLYKTNMSAYSAVRWYHATLENGTLKAGELAGETVAENPTSDILYLYWGEEDVGDYYIAEVIDDFYTKKIGFHIVEGTLPDAVPVHYARIVGLSQVAHFVAEDGQSFAVVPAGTVVTLPTDTSAKFVSTSSASLGGASASVSRLAFHDHSVETYLCNGRRCFTVEPGQKYEVHYFPGTRLIRDGDYIDSGIGDSYAYIMAGENTPASGIAYASTQTVNVDGKTVTFECYALKDENGNATNYIKLRDLAVLLNGSAAQFQVGWDGSVTIATKTAYTPNGSELSTPYTGDRPYQEAAAVTKVNGQAAALAAFMLTDDQGGGYTYYQLRDLGQALGFNVGWSADKGIFVETDKPYDPNN